MLNPEIWVQGLTTMLVGMGIVFSFLIVLVFAIMIMVKVVNYLNKIFPVEETGVKTTKKAVSSDDSEIAIAIAMAKSQC